MLIVAFILCTVVGTISHEYGHIVVAKYFGYETNLYYASMDYYPKGYLEDEDYKAYVALTNEYRDLDYESWPEEVKEKVTGYTKRLEERYWNEQARNSFYVTLGGPIQTILTGMIGLSILFFRRKSIQAKGLQLLDWVAVFLGLFWLREIFNLTLSVAIEILSPDGRWFGGDEYYLSIGLRLWPGTVPILLGVLGLLVSLYIIFVVIPKHLRLTFIMSGLIGGIAGYILWIYIVGPQVLPY